MKHLQFEINGLTIIYPSNKISKIEDNINFLFIYVKRTNVNVQI